MSVDSHNKFLQSDQNVLSRLLLAQQARQHALAAEERRYVPRVDTLKIILALALVPVSYQVVAQEMQMFDVYSTAEKLETSWDFVMEVEHKSAVDLYKTSSCLSSEEFINEFPISDHTGLYWDYVSSRQISRQAVEYYLGQIGELRIYEIVIFIEGPIDYIKTLGFRSESSELFCPFLMVAEWEHQLIYSRSYIDEFAGTDRIVTRMIDNIASQGPTIKEFNFTVGNNIPTFIN